MLLVAPYLFCVVLSGIIFVLWRKLGAQPSLIAAHATAVATQAQLEKELLSAREQLDAMQQQLAEMRTTESTLSTALALAEQKVEVLTAQRKSDAEILEELKLSTRAGVMQVGQELSSKLLDDAKREREQEQKRRDEQMKRERTESQEQLQKIMHNVTEQLAQLQGKAAALDSHQKQLGHDLETINRALTNPISAGAQAEIGFENLLTNLGLIAGQDFFLQYQFTSDEGRTLRPDCVVMLPQETALVIDCKSSPYVLELAASEGTPEYEAVLKKFAASMQTHLKSLATKEYALAIQKLLKTETRKTISRVINVMYCPTESALERVLKFDPSLRDRASAASIVLAGPASLQGLFQIAKLQVMQAQQTANQQQILQILAQWMSDVMGALTHADKIGASIKRAMDSYDDLAGAVNRNVLGRLQRLITLGVEPAKAGQAPKRLLRYDITRHDDVVNGEAEEIPTLLNLPKDAA